MQKDARLDIIGDLIKVGRIDEFADIFIYVPTTVFAKYLGWNQIRVRGYYLGDLGSLRLDDIFKMADLLGVDVDVLTRIIYNQMKRQRKARLGGK